MSNRNTMSKNILIIGGGAAGMMAAIAASEKGNRVTLVEKNEELGKKLLVTGNGRCNVTNIAEPREMLAHVVSNGKFLHSAFHGFSSADLIELLEGCGVSLKEEEDGRMFPRTEKAVDVRDALRLLLVERNVNIIRGYEVEGLIIKDGVCEGIKGIAADYTIIATGGMSYPNTGSTGDGFKWAKEAGHTIVKPRPGLTGLIIQEDSLRSLQGISLENAKLSFKEELDNTHPNPKRKPKEKLKTGDIIFTHFGISGPAAIKMSSYLPENCKEIKMDSLPKISRESIESLFINGAKEHGKKEVKTVLAEALPRSFVEFLLTKSDIPEDRRLADMTKVERNKLINEIKEMTFKIEGLQGFNSAMITRGGVATGQIDPKTMESRIVKGLKFAGEVIDVDAETGGFNLQIAWSTGWISGATIC